MRKNTAKKISSFLGVIRLKVLRACFLLKIAEGRNSAERLVFRSPWTFKALSRMLSKAFKSGNSLVLVAAPLPISPRTVLFRFRPSRQPQPAACLFAQARSHCACNCCQEPSLTSIGASVLKFVFGYLVFRLAIWHNLRCCYFPAHPSGAMSQVRNLYVETPG